MTDPVKNLFWYIKNSGEILDKLKGRDFNATSLSHFVGKLFLCLESPDDVQSVA